VRVQLLELDPDSYRPHALHGEDREWRETNCAADLWIESLHALNLDPVLGLAFTLSTDFDGDQWRMFTYPPEDLRRLFGIESDELNVWRPLDEHVEEQLRLGRMLMVDVDAWHLPDTAGLTYRQAHQKTSVMVQMVDRERKRLGYFHNTGYYELQGDDFEGALGVAGLPPYVMSVRLEGVRPVDAHATEVALDLAREHLARRPASNPIARLAKRLNDDIGWLTDGDVETFHRYAFGTVRQCGSNAELAASFADWLGRASGVDERPAVEGLGRVARGMKAVEFLLARAVRGRPRPLDPSMHELESAWESALAHLVRHHGC
jgi:hypothetical protein